jgi:lipopolysaccharide/colanic/teichoic acid biosynthesis glycosyltransferase
MGASATARKTWTVASRAVTSDSTLGPSLTPSSIRVRAQAAPLVLAMPKDEHVRRLLNILVASIGLILTAPLMLMIALAIKLTSRGPVIYKQPRVGVDRRMSRGPDTANQRRQQDRGGRIFTIYKFRSMRVNAPSAPQVWAKQGDPRITAIGRFLRACRLDELPQLFNVLKGDMNIVGPRPEQPEIFRGLSEELGHYRKRQRVLPGITGLAQVTLPYDASLDDVKKKVDLDLQYIRQRSATRDLLIMAKTMPVMVMRKGSV